MSCLYSADPTTEHSTRVGTALDGNGIYGHNIDGGCEPIDLDACGGRTGVTPDSGGEPVYYYVITNKAPFALGCFGKKDHFTTVDECRALYPDSCGNTTVTFTTAHGSGEYDLDCPCFDEDGSNVPGQGKPGFLAAAGYDESELETTDLYSSSNYCPSSTVTPQFDSDLGLFYFMIIACTGAALILAVGACCIAVRRRRANAADGRYESRNYSFRMSARKAGYTGKPGQYQAYNPPSLSSGDAGAPITRMGTPDQGSTMELVL